MLSAESIVESIARDFDTLGMCVCGEKVGECRKKNWLRECIWYACVMDVLCAAFIKYEINSRPYALLLYGERPNVFCVGRAGRVFFCIPPVHGLVFNAIYGVARDGTLPEPPTPESHSSAASGSERSATLSLGVRLLH